MNTDSKLPDGPLPDALCRDVAAGRAIQSKPHGGLASMAPDHPLLGGPCVDDDAESPRVVSMGVAQAEAETVHLSLPRGGWLCRRGGEHGLGVRTTADINYLTCPVCEGLHESAH